ncbi:hypothetical protein [Sphingomonas sp.]|uniref:hypothetical protein n=1 Tax=Sphingomonas sp. TaxID=28214 RepID=UPI00289D11B7|nr:hypothetical protein [Sphingomonas sp.]
MKLVFLAATALIAAPVFAQDTTQAGAAITTDGAMATQQGGMTAQTGASASAGTETPGGYQPAQPAMAGMPQPGAPVVFKQAPSPEQAYPAPQPLKSYPICKKGQFDQCRQRGGK